MYIRWKKRKLKDGTNRLDAVLVESYRVDDKVKQRSIKYLASVTPDIYFDSKAHYCMVEDQFLEYVKYQLDKLDLDSSEREKIEEMAVKRFQNTIKM